MAQIGAAVELIDISKTYRTRRGEQLVALSDTSLKVVPGEFVTIVGPSGCGKTTLLNIVGGLTEASTGAVMLNGAPRTLRQRADIGFMFQEPTLLLWRSVLENVLLPVEIRRYTPKKYEPRARELIALLGLSGFEGAYPHELSGGMQQRVAIARSLVLNSPLLLMDEPFSALDAFTRERLADELLLIWDRNRKTVLFVTHNITEAVFLADRVVVMGPRPGRVIAQLESALPRPRGPDTLSSAAYAALIAEVRHTLQNAGSLDDPLR